MIQSLRFFGFFMLALLFLHSNTQSEHGSLYSVPTLETAAVENTNIPNYVQPFSLDNSLLNQNTPTAPLPDPIEHIPAYITPIQSEVSRSTGVTPITTDLYNTTISSISSPMMNPVNSYDYQYSTPTAPLAPPVPQIETIIMGLNKTISLYSRQSQIYLMPVIESKKQSIFFLVVNPQNNVTYEKTSIKISHKNNQTLINSCKDIGVNVCLVPGQLINIGDQLSVNISCSSDETCIFNLETYWSTTYPLHINKPLIMDFEQDAYAKLFHLDVTNKEFKQLRIQLTTKTALVGDAPIHLYANFGNQPPSKEKHHFAGVHLWDDGLGIFISKALFNSTQLTIIVEGPASNVLEIEAKVVTEYYKEIKLDQLQFDYLAANEFRTYYISLPQKIVDLTLKLSTFTGGVELDFYKDENLNQIFMVGEFQTFGDRLYHLPASHITGSNITNHLFVKVKNSHNPSTYVLKLTSPTQKSILLSTDISDMGEVKKGQIVNYHINTYIESSVAYPKVLKFVIHHLYGTNTPVFRLCHQQQVSKCYVDYNTYINNKSAYDQIKPTTVATTGTSSIVKIQINPSQFVQETHAAKYKKAVLSIIIAEENERFLYGIQFSDDSVVKTLREGTPLKDRVNIGSRRLYRVAPLSKDIVTVHIHLVEISGKVEMFGAKADPRVTGYQLQGMDVPKKNQLMYEASALNAHHTIFVVVEGEENAIFSLTVTFKRNVELSQNGQFKDKFNYVAIPPNSDQQITIQPQTYEVIFLSTAYGPHTFTYTSSFHLQFCARKDNTRFPRDPYCDIKINSTKTDLPEAKSYYISIGNPGNTTAVASVKYSNAFFCEEKNLGSVWKKYLETPNISSCVKYTIHKNQSLEVITSIDTYSYPSMHSTIYINDFEYPLNLPYIFIDAKAFEEHCNSAYCVVVVLFSNLTKSNVQLAVQHIDQEIVLLDGISQQVHTVASPNVYKKFSFSLPNKQETTIILESKQGSFDFFVSVHDEYEGHLNDNIYPTKDTSMFKGNSTYYTLFRTQVISSEQLKNVNCSSCVMYITVAGTENTYSEKARFVVEVTQERRTLKPLTLTPGYISANSLHYYEYQFKNDNGTLVVSLSTQNTNCANTYIVKGKDKSNPMMNNVKSYGDETITSATKGIYTIVLEATNNCKYTISVSETTIKISEIKQGIYKDLKLQKDQTAYLFYHHTIETPFKILSMEQYGEVMISVATMDRTAIQALGNITNIDDKSLSKFQWSGGKDVIRVATTDKGYCVNCYYLVYVKAMKKTETSLILATTNIDVPMSQGDQVTDIMGAEQVMYYKMYTYNSKSVNISMFVHYGELEFTVEGTTNTSHTFKKSNQTQIWTVPMSDDRTMAYKPTHFHIKSKEASMYRMIIKTEDRTFSGGKHPNRQMKFGYPTYIFLDKKEETCAEAIMTENDQKLLVSVSRGQKSKIHNLTITVKIGNTTINNIKNEIIQSTMVVSLDKSQILPSQKTNITYCFKSTDYLSVTLIPTATVTFFPENSQILINKQHNMTLNAVGKLYVEVFECEGNANIMLSKKFIKLKGGVSELIHWRRFGANYLIELDENGLIYMNIDGGKTLVKWQHINRELGEGLGYYYFSPPHFIYESNSNRINFEIPPLIQMEALVNNTTILGINYTLMASDNKKTLKSAVQCNIGGLVRDHKFIEASEMNQTLRMSLEVSALKERYPEKNYIFASIVAQMTIRTPSNKTEVYKFLFEDEQIMFTNESLTKEKDVHEKYGTLFWILWGATLVLIALYFITKIVVAKYKSRHMSLAQGTDVQINEVDSIR